MKKLVNLAFFYAIAGLLSGLFYREYTKLLAFEGETALSTVHTHLLSMGMLFMLVLLALVILLPLMENKWFKRFLMTYNLGFLVTVIMMIVRGIVDVKVAIASPGLDGSIAGMAGLGHIALTVAIVMLFIGLKQVVVEQKG